MARQLLEYFQSADLFAKAIGRYQKDFVDGLGWSITGEFGKLHAYTLMERALDPQYEKLERRDFMSMVIDIVRSWNGDINDLEKIIKYGNPPEVLWNLEMFGKKYRSGNLSLIDLTADDYSTGQN